MLYFLQSIYPKVFYLYLVTFLILTVMYLLLHLLSSYADVLLDLRVLSVAFKYCTVHYSVLLLWCYLLLMIF